MSHSQPFCRDCGAWVDRRAAHCPVCGIASPLAAWRTQVPRWFGKDAAGWADLGTVAGALAGLGLGLGIGQGITHVATDSHLHRLLVVLAIPAAASLAAAIGWLAQRGRGAVGGLLYGTVIGLMVEGQLAQRLGSSLVTVVTTALAVWGGARVGRRLGTDLAARWVDQRKPQSLQATREFVQGRLAELRTARQRIDVLQGRLEAEVPAGGREAALGALQAAEEATDRQIASYQVDLWRMDIAAWQHRLQPLLRTWRELDDRACERALQQVAAAREQLDDWVRQWTPTLAGQTDRGRRCVDQAQRLAGATDKLRQALLVRQAVALAAASPGVHEAFATQGLPPETLQQIDLLRARDELGAYAADTRHLQDEGVRLRAELEAIQQVERLVPHSE